MVLIVVGVCCTGIAVSCAEWRQSYRAERAADVQLIQAVGTTQKLSDEDAK